jgi:LmbE family N-acetylglucosaminyl deacetylase
MDGNAILQADNVLVLVARPDDAVRHCGALIAGLCRAGRPPFVVVLTDGNAAGADADREARTTLAGCGLDRGRLLMFGIAGAMPAGGDVFDAAVAALCFVAWRHDCNVLCAPQAALPVARAASAASGVAVVGADAGQFDLIAPPRRSARDPG